MVANEAPTPSAVPQRSTVGKGSWLSSSWVWLLLLAGVVWLQWPIVKDVYYELAGVELPQQTIDWQHDLETALATARTQQRPVLVVFGAEWCPPCRAMKREVWPDAEVSQAVEANFVPVYIDIDDQQRRSISARYGISSIPSVLILNHAGDVLSHRNSMSRSQTLQFLQAAPTS